MGFFSASVTNKSKSPTVSLPRRNDPAGVTLSTKFLAFKMCTPIFSAASSAVLVKNLPVDFLNTSTAFKIFCSLFSPKPARSRSLPSRAILSMSATVQHWNWLHKNATFFGPNDCRLSNSRMVAGYFFSSFFRKL